MIIPIIRKGLQFYNLAADRRNRGHGKFLGNFGRESRSRFGFALDYEDLLEPAAFGAFREPLYERRLGGRSGIAAEGFDATADRNRFAEDFHDGGAVENTATERALSLIADEHDRRVWIRQIAPLVMENAAAGGHA